MPDLARPLAAVPVRAPTAEGRDRVVDAVRSSAMLAVALGHWLVFDLRRGPSGELVAIDVLERLPWLQPLSWLFQVMPVFFFAGGVVAFRSWHRHREAGRPVGAWVAARLWRLLWPTLVVTAFWVVATQVGLHLLHVAPEVLDATRGIAFVIWFLAAYAAVITLVPLLDAGCRRWGLGVPAALAGVAVVVDVAAAATGYESSTRPSWVWVNYLAVWGTVVCLGRWWPPTPSPALRRAGWSLVGGAGLVLVVLTATGWYPVSMVGVTGMARSNTTPPSVALLALALVQVGVLVVARPVLERRLASPRVQRAVLVLGARAMTVYLWHLLAVAVLALGAVLPGWWPDPAVGSGPWWLLRVGWVLAATAITLPVVVVVGRVERAPAVALTDRTGRAVLAVLAAVVGWAALAIVGFQPAGMPGRLPVVAIVGLGAAAALLVGQSGGIASRSTSV